MHHLRILMAGLLCLSVLSSCASSDTYAPVADVSGYEAVPSSGVYRVASGDTLYSIAWRYGADYQVLARNNYINAPYAIHVGQILYLRGSPQKRLSIQTRLPIRAKLPLRPVVVSQPAMAETKEPNYHVVSWLWPAHGKLLALYSSKNKGIDIGGMVGAPVYAAASAKVVYAGNGLRGYGNLIILKHNSQFLSAYAYNSRLFVREGDWVKKGQIIAAMGMAPGSSATLHFEIRRAGLPVNPLNLLS